MYCHAEIPLTCTGTFGFFNEWVSAHGRAYLSLQAVSIRVQTPGAFPHGNLGLGGGIGQCCSSLCSCPVRFHLLSSFPGRNSNIFVPLSKHFCESLSSNVVHLPLHLVGSHGRCLRRRRAGQACSDSPSDYFPSQLNLQIKDFLKRRLCLCVQLDFFPSVNVSGPFLNSSQFLASTRPCGGEFHSFHTPPSQMEK